MLSLFLLISFMVLGSNAGEGGLRLVNKWHHGQCGRLQYQLYNGTWGTICDNKFDENAASVACRQLGYRTAKAVLYEYFINQPISAPVVIDAVVCVGNERRLVDCFLSRNDGTSFCTHDNDVGIHCTNQLATSTIILITVLSAMASLCSLCICCTCRRVRSQYHDGQSRRGTYAASYYGSVGRTAAPPSYKDASTCEETSTEMNSTYQSIPSPITNHVTSAPPPELNTMPPSYAESQSVQPEHPPSYQ